MNASGLNIHFGTCSCDVVAARLDEVLKQLAEIKNSLAAIKAAGALEGTKMSKMDDELTTLTASVAAEGDEIKAANLAFSGISKQLTDALAAAAAAGATPAQLQAIVDLNTAVQAQTAALAAAIPAGTPAA